jgi:thiaminase (transcriptional activator TenA)
MSFSREAWQLIAPLYRAILDLPFNRELAAGSLSRERFTFYMLQDAHYLTYFARALAVTAARAPDNDALIQFAGSAREAVVVERALHEGFFNEYGISPTEAAATEPSPTCAHYTHYLLAVAYNAPYEVAVAALLPCFWIYWEVGRHLLATAQPDNPYQAWIDTYADEAFGEGVRKVITVADQLAATASPTVRDQMFHAFVRASHLEWMFWDSAYHLERWPAGGPEHDFAR